MFSMLSVLAVLFFTTNAGIGDVYSQLLPQMYPLMQQFPYQQFGVSNFADCQDQDGCKAAFQRAEATSLYNRNQMNTLPSPVQQMIQTTVKKAPEPLLVPHDDCYVFDSKDACNGHILDKGCLWTDTAVGGSCGKAPPLPACSFYKTEPQCLASSCYWKAASAVTQTTTTTGTTIPAVTTTPASCEDPTVLVNTPVQTVPQTQQPQMGLNTGFQTGMTGGMNGLNAMSGLTGMNNLAGMNLNPFASLAGLEMEEYMEQLGFGNNLAFQQQMLGGQSLFPTSLRRANPLYTRNLRNLPQNRPMQRQRLSRKRPMRPVFRNPYSPYLYKH